MNSRVRLFIQTHTHALKTCRRTNAKKISLISSLQRTQTTGDNNHEDSKLLPQIKSSNLNLNLEKIACNLKTRYRLLASVDPANIMKLKASKVRARSKQVNEKNIGVADINFLSLDDLTDFPQKGEKSRTINRNCLRDYKKEEWEKICRNRFGRFVQYRDHLVEMIIPTGLCNYNR
uniref:Uncharacterized protein n=1 Tax=Glossina pallidipes TaxID=7398 RepID=A0A1B0AF56_GLOPL